MRYKELPSSLQLRLLTFYHYRNKKAFERNQRIIEEVSPYLREVHFTFPIIIIENAIIEIISFSNILYEI